jgi:uncharacterized protein
MRYLLDVNALIALGLGEHTEHTRVSTWAFAMTTATFLTCSITELGFVRIIAQVPEYDPDVADAQNLLAHLKMNELFKFSFISDNHGISQLPAWVKNPRQTTDGHLLELAKAHNARLATLDSNIPGAFLIP